MKLKKVKILARKIWKYINFKTLSIASCILIFILINSIQEDYIGLDEIPASELITTNTGTTPPTQPTNPTEPTGPTFPTDTFTQPDGGIDTGREPSIPAQVIPGIIAALVGILLVFLFLRRRKATSDYMSYIPPSQGVLRSRRDRFRTEIKSLIEILKEYLEQNKFNEGIIFGFHQLDQNMKRILGIRRETHLTPKEFSRSLDLPEIIPFLNSIIETFYITRYKNEEMSYDKLENFIEDLQQMQNLSKAKSGIQIVDRKVEEGYSE
jgi:hypothetical protein